MTAIDPFLDRSQNSAVARLETREMAMLSHDIRGALMGVMGAAGYLETAELDAAVRPQIERICAAARTLASLVAVVLGEEPGPAGIGGERRIETAALLAHLRRRYAAEAADRGLRFAAEAGEGVPFALLTDPIALCRMIDNLVGNAIKFCDQGAVVLRVARGADGSIVFRVADDGPGLDGEGVAAPAARAGQGLGLEIVRTLAARAGAEARVGNRPSGGVEAVLRFPAGAAEERPPVVAARGEADLAGIRVLLAEDNPTNQIVASQMLRSLRAEVTVCADGVEALERFEQEPVDLVVVDIEMPRLSGLDVIRAIRARGDDRAQVPIVALTAYAMREHRERIAAAGANGLISKPITSVEELGRGLAAHVRRRPAAPEAPRADARGPVIVQAIYDALVEAIGPETMAELLDKVIADLMAAQQDLAAALVDLDRASIRSATHILISVAGAFGAARLQDCARQLNGIAQTAAPADVQETTRRCIVEIDAAMAFARGRRAAR